MTEMREIGWVLIPFKRHDGVEMVIRADAIVAIAPNPNADGSCIFVAGSEEPFWVLGTVHDAIHRMAKTIETSAYMYRNSTYWTKGPTT